MEADCRDVVNIEKNEKKDGKRSKCSERLPYGRLKSGIGSVIFL